jgi:hypothetical protein
MRGMTIGKGMTIGSGIAMGSVIATGKFARLTLACIAGLAPAGVAGLRSVAPGFSRGYSNESRYLEPALAGERIGGPSCRPLKRARNIGVPHDPPAEAGGYGSQAGYAGETTARTQKENLTWI